ncbi:MAG: chorismate synthase [Spirochaetota bacterium]
MSGNSFGRLFKITTFGESHGSGIGVVIDGVPPGIALTESDIQRELDRRRPGQSSISTERNESDRVEILSGMIDGITTGAPVTLYVRNENQRPEDYESLKELYRPGHADYTYEMKYGIRDWRGGGRASGRETAARVAAGAVAKKLLKECGIEVIGYTLEIGGVGAEIINYDEIEKNPVRSPDPGKASEMLKRIQEVKAGGDSIGGVVEVVVKGVPPGLGDPVFDKLDALLTHAVMSVGAVKGVEIGRGFQSANMKGSEFNDPFEIRDGRIRTRTNNAGGILGGISTGEDILIRAAIRPAASIRIKQKTVDRKGQERDIEVYGRHDPCIVPRVVPVIESMVSIVIVDCLLLQYAYQNWVKNRRSPL